MAHCVKVDVLVKLLVSPLAHSPATCTLLKVAECRPENYTGLELTALSQTGWLSVISRTIHDVALDVSLQVTLKLVESTSLAVTLKGLGHEIVGATKR